MRWRRAKKKETTNFFSNENTNEESQHEILERGYQKKSSKTGSVTKTKIPVVGVTGSGKTWFMASIGYFISHEGIYDPVDEMYEPIGFIKGDGYIQRIMRQIMKGEPPEPTTLGVLHKVTIGIELEKLGIKNDHNRIINNIMELSADDISGEDYKYRNPDTFIPAVKGSDAIVVVLDASKTSTLVDQMAMAASIPLDLMELGTDIRNMPFAFIFSKADESDIKEINKCGSIDPNSDIYDEITQVLAPATASIHFNKGNLGIFSVSATQGTNKIQPKGFREFIEWIGYNLFKEGSLRKRKQSVPVRAPQMRVPIVGVPGSGKSTFYAALAQWVSLGQRKDGKFYPFGYVCEGLDYITKYLTQLQNANSTLDPTVLGSEPKKISIYIDPQRLGLPQDCKPFEILSGDIAGDSYIHLDEHFTNLMNETQGVVILIDKLSNGYDLADQMEKAVNVPIHLIDNNVNISDKCFSLVMTKCDLLGGHYAKYGRVRPFIHNSQKNPVFEEFRYYFSPVIASIHRPGTPKKHQITKRVQFFTTSLTGGIDEGPIDPKGFEDLISFIARRLSGNFKSN